MTMMWAMGMAAALGLAGAVVGGASAQEPEIPKPRLGLFVTVDEIAAARQKAETVPWAKAQKERILEVADAWVARDDAWIRNILPPPDAKYAYGTAGCPHCGKSWRPFGLDTASFDRPKVLICPHCDTKFDLNNPSGPYADHGDGVRVNGRMFWLQGVWNGFVTSQMWSAWNVENTALPNLADAYALTGDPKYAHKAAVIMDALATIAPYNLGPRDFNDDPKTDMGRFSLLTSIVFRAQSPLSRALDVVGRLPEFDRPSPTNPGKTMWQNIRDGLYEDYLFNPIDTRNAALSTLHNHEADSYRGLVLAGLMFGVPEYVRWGAEGFQAFLDNTIDRDGLYYETSLSYTGFTRTVFLEMAEVLARYNPDQYPAELGMPRRADLPYNGNFFNNPRLARLTLDQPARVSVVGREPTYGNSGFDVTVFRKPGRPINRWELEQSSRFVKYATDPAIRSHAAEVAAGLLGSMPAPVGTGPWYYWPLYIEPSAETIRAAAGSGAAAPSWDSTDLFGQTGLTFLRSGKDENRRAAVMRFGPNMPHSHNDAGALMLYGQGRALSGDVGYGIFGNHVHLGWASQAIAHHTVVINQDKTAMGRQFRVIPGGTVEDVYSGPGISWAVASLANIYPPEDGVKEYRRTVMQLDLSPEQYYWVDLFDVEGGQVHDYSMHSLPTGDKGLDMRGVSPAPVPGVWTLAGLDPEWRDASFDEPGRAWGERLTVNGLVRNLPDGPKDASEATWWYAPPQNGYGFLYDVKAADTTAPWSAVWRYTPKEGPYAVRLTMHPQEGQKVITAYGPTLTGADRMPFLIARRGAPDGKESVRSRYVGVIDTYGEAPVVSKSEAIRQSGRVVGLKVTAGAREDTILDARKGAITAAGVPALEAGLGVVRRDGGEVAGLVLSGGPVLAADGFAVRLMRPVHNSRIVGVDDAKGAFRVSPAFPAAASGSTVVVNNPAYRRGSTYRVGASAADGTVTPLLSDASLGKGRVETPTEGGFTSKVPLVFAHIHARDTNLLDGKRIVSGGKTGNIRTVNEWKNVKTTGITPKAGDEFVVYDVQPGDTVSMEGAASLTRDADGVWSLRANGPCRVAFPWHIEREQNGKWTRVVGRHLDLSDAELTAGPVRFRRAK